MRIAVMSDFHFGYPRFYDDSFIQARRALEAGADSDLILIAGDLFDSRVPKQEVFARAFDIFAPITAKKHAKITVRNLRDEPIHVPQVAIVAIHGTHERRAKEFVNPIEVMEKAGFLVDAHVRKVEFEKNGEKIVIQGLGGVPEQYAKPALRKINFKPISGAFNIFVFHQTMQEFVPSRNELFMTKEDLPKGFDLYVCGHIHWKREFPVDNTKLIIPGSTIVTQLRKNETGDKGIIIYDTKTNNYEFKKIKTRPFIFKELKIENATPSDVINLCKSELDHIDAEKPIVKLKVVGSLAEGVSISDIDLQQLIVQYSDKMLLEIEKALEFQELKEQIQYLRDVKAGKVSVRDQGNQYMLQMIPSLSADKINDLFELFLDEKKMDSAIDFLRHILH